MKTMEYLELLDKKEELKRLRDLRKSDLRIFLEGVFKENWGLFLFMLFTFLVVVIFSGCGSDPSAPENVPTKTQLNNAMQTTIDANMPYYKKLCVEDHLPLLDNAKVNCMVLNQDEAFCENERQAEIQILNNTWNDIEAAAAANMLACSNDFRVTADYCFAAHEQEITRRLYEC